MGRKSLERLELEKSQVINQNYKKSNTLINAKGKTSFLGQKLFSIGILNIKEDEENKQLYSVTYASQIKKLLNVTRGSIYTSIKQELTPADNKKPTLLDWRMVYVDDKTKKISVSNIITDADYSNGELTIIYNYKLKDYLIGLSSNYTLIDIHEQFSCKSQYGFRLYEILKKNLDKIQAVTKSSGSVEWTVNVTDLKLMMGIVDLKEHPEIEALLKKTETDWERIEEILNDKKIKYARYCDFKAKALNKGLEEVNNLTSINCSMTEMKAGKGGKVKEIVFTISYKDVMDKKDSVLKKLSEEDKDNIIDEIFELTEGKIRITECRKIAQASGYDLEAVKKAYFLALKSKTRINNLTGWLIKAIQQDYSENVSFDPSGYGNFESRQESLDELEDVLLDN